MEDLPVTHHAVARDEELREGGLLAVEADGREIALCRVEGAIHAVALRCTHAAWPMRDGPLEGCELVCVAHGARFDVRDGHPTAGPAERPLETWPVRVRDGWIEVALPPRPARRPRTPRRPLATGPGDA